MSSSSSSSSLSQLIFDLRQYVKNDFEGWRRVRIAEEYHIPAKDLTPDKVEQLIQDLEHQLGWDVPLTQEQLLVLYEQLYVALTTGNGKDVVRTVAALRFEPMVARYIIDDDQYRSEVGAVLSEKISLMIQAGITASSPGEYQTYYGYFFNKDEFAQRMMLDQLKLQDEALMKAPGGVHFLETVFELPPTDRLRSFLINYNQKYYTRRCADYGRRWACAFKAGVYRDLEMMEKYYLTNPVDVLAGAVDGGHLDLIKEYFEAHPDLIDGVSHLLTVAARVGDLEIYKYLKEFDAFPGVDLNIIIIATRNGHLEFLRYLMTMIDLDDQDVEFSLDMTQAAVGSGKDYIIDEVKALGLFVPYVAGETAVERGNVEILMQYMDALKQEPDDFLQNLPENAATAEIGQILYDAGIRAKDISVLMEPLLTGT